MLYYIYIYILYIYNIIYIYYIYIIYVYIWDKLYIWDNSHAFHDYANIPNFGEACGISSNIGLWENLQGTIDGPIAHIFGDNGDYPGVNGDYPMYRFQISMRISIIYQ